ncbi:OmpW family outer membrane protein [Bisgaard Taxon 10/6]|uniref:OmpW family outer membrane protein n=1 Tax=Exercitatus varius TaxID=67857 RepID=A0AAW6Q9Q2_9PAST|nr:OmpW family outer membrane protein [Exercitatus varius]QOF68792.1 outer membrane beta-barrel protein [Actinobacillus sp. GY-402]MDG2916490.1 OmpW family outer membrane protein [Exercitatus varius]MDG2947670.1 OmpW family outer membrane protein [Exercitatus varius]MDG2948935.1 OmpW family outer membrane protein [Exercitatus varius]MDG2951524.1 OmpW family outer membrane protein [Exercitatus varius]
MKKSMLALGIAATLISSAASAHEAGSWIVRAGAAHVMPTHVENTSNTAAPALGLDVNANTQLGLTGTYMITDNIGVELLAASPFSHEITLGGQLVGKTKHLPPSLYAQYYFLNKEAKARPYLGAGINYTNFFNETEKMAGVTDLKLHDSWGLVLNGGLDINLTDNLLFNTAVYYAKIKTKADFKVAGTQLSQDVRLDPLVFFMGIGYRF